jgi:hypothetical protein
LLLKLEYVGDVIVFAAGVPPSLATSRAISSAERPDSVSGLSSPSSLSSASESLGSAEEAEEDGEADLLGVPVEQAAAGVPVAGEDLVTELLSFDSFEEVRNRVKLFFECC